MLCLAPRRKCKSVPQIREKPEAREGKILRLGGEELVSGALRKQGDRRPQWNVSAHLRRLTQILELLMWLTAFAEICLKKSKSMSLKSHEA